MGHLNVTALCWRKQQVGRRAPRGCLVPAVLPPPPPHTSSPSQSACWYCTSPCPHTHTHTHGAREAAPPHETAAAEARAPQRSVELRAEDEAELTDSRAANTSDRWEHVHLSPREWFCITWATFYTWSVAWLSVCVEWRTKILFNEKSSQPSCICLRLCVSICWKTTHICLLLSCPPVFSFYLKTFLYIWSLNWNMVTTGGYQYLVRAQYDLTLTCFYSNYWEASWRLAAHDSKTWNNWRKIDG